MIAKYGPLIEIGGGLGHWQSMLASRGVDIISFVSCAGDALQMMAPRQICILSVIIGQLS
jgi:hypothetical protein